MSASATAALFEAACALRDRAGGPPTVGRAPLPPLFLVTDALRLSDPIPAARALPAGCGVLFRHYGVPGRSDLARALAETCRTGGLALVVSSDADLAAAVGARGVHWPEGMAASAPGYSGGIVTASAHSAEAVARAAIAGVDAVFASPVLATDSHPGRAPLGVAGFSTLARGATVPVFALGGITAENAVLLADSGAAGLAALGALATARQPAQ
jgi:thiamine-phosphate pyrophosphorylase